MNTMAKSRNVNVSFPERLVEYIKSKVDMDPFHHEADFIRHAIRKMQESETAANDFNLDAADPYELPEYTHLFASCTLVL